MRKPAFDLRKASHFLIILTLVGLLLFFAKTIILPLLFAVIFSLILDPICSFFQKYLRWRWLAILATFLAIFIPVSIGIFLFTYQLKGAVEDYSLITERLEVAINEGFAWINQYVPISRKKGLDYISENLTSIIDQPFDMISASISASTSFVSNFFLVLLYSFFFLYYKAGITSFLLQQSSKKHRESAANLLSQIKNITQDYLLGLGTVMLILGILNSVGLMVIGIDYAFFWGFLAAFLAVIPYIGTFIGGFLPFLYALAVTDTQWQPLAVIGLFVLVQTLEGNFITPKVVGDNISINPFTAILGLIIGGSLWGIAGMVLALPLLAIFKVVCDHVPALQPVGFLISNDLFDKPETFLKNWDSDKFRLFSLFRERQ